MMTFMVSYFVLSFSHEMSWMRSGTELSQLLRIFLLSFPTWNLLLKRRKLFPLNNDYNFYDRQKKIIKMTVTYPERESIHLQIFFFEI